MDSPPYQPLVQDGGGSEGKGKGGGKLSKTPKAAAAGGGPALSPAEHRRAVRRCLCFVFPLPSWAKSPPLARGSQLMEVQLAVRLGADPLALVSAAPLCLCWATKPGTPGHKLATVIGVQAAVAVSLQSADIGVLGHGPWPMAAGGGGLGGKGGGGKGKVGGRGGGGGGGPRLAERVAKVAKVDVDQAK